MNYWWVFELHFKFFSWKRLLHCSWCTSYYTSQPIDCALAFLCRPGGHLSIKYQTDTQACVRTYTALAWRSYACVWESLPYFPSTEYKSRNVFHFPFSWWFQKSLAKIQREQYKNYRKGLYRIEWEYCYSNVQKKTEIKIVVQPLSNNNSGLLSDEERRPYWSAVWTF